MKNPVRSHRFTQQHGIALIVVLVVLLIVTVLIVAFLSRTLSSRKLSASNSNQALTAILGESALNLIVGDLQNEIISGSSSDGETPPVYIPKDRATAVPQLVGSAADLPNVIKVSRGGIAFFSGTDFSTPGPIRAASASTAIDSLNGRSIDLRRWNLPLLMTPDATGAPPTTFAAPDWIFVDRNGSNPTAWIAGLKNRTPDNNDYVVGRFAYVIYNVGGLLNINSAGFPRPVEGLPGHPVAKKGSPAYAELNAIGLNDAQITNFIGWRNFASTAPSPSYGGGFPEFNFDASSAQRFADLVSDDKDGFKSISIDVNNGRTDQRILGRQHLMKLASSLGIPNTSLQYLTPFSSFVNAPSYFPAPGRARVNRSGYPTDDQINPNLASIRSNDGKPLLKQRFALKRIALLAAGADSSDVQKYFGLTRSGDRWTYRNGATKILPLSQVATQARDPDFFELLQAAILAGSLGKSGGDTAAVTASIDENPYYQIISIGANIIDQYDSDDFPTAIRFDGKDFYGQENLPYVSEIVSVVFRVDSSTLRGWYLCELWNPNANAKAPNDIDGYRFRATGGKAAIRVAYKEKDGVPVDKVKTSNYQNVAGSIQFPANADYGEPVAFPKNVSPLDPAFSGILAAEFNPISSHWGPGPQESYNRSWIFPESTNASGSGPKSGTDPVSFVLEYQSNGQWHPYQTIQIYRSAQNEDNKTNPYQDWTRTMGTNNASRIMVPFAHPDPRTMRFGLSTWEVGATPGESMRPTSAEWSKGAPGSTNWQEFGDSLPSGIEKGGSANGFSLLKAQSLGTNIWAGPLAGFATNTRDSLNLGNPMHYSDPDNVIRVGDAYFGAFPTVPVTVLGNSALSGRPIILNRPFQSVGELGYAFRDMPWKTLDFFSKDSADSAMLDVFSMDEEPLVAGKVDLNTRNPQVLEAILRGVAERNLVSTQTPQVMSQARAIEIANAFVTQTKAKPLRNRSEMVSYSADSSDNSDSLSENAVFSATVAKTEREATVRALSEVGDVRTWNLMIDLVVQSGRFPVSASNFAQFQVEGERRFWLHLAIDRYSGDIVDSFLETVYE